MICRTVVAGALLASAAWGQVSFEVASVKMSAPNTPWRGRPGADRIEFQGVTLWYCISYAYGVKSYQMSGPDWLRQVRYDIAAKAPAGAPREQLPEMMRALLAERFQVRIHRETREIPALALTVGKDGPKLKEAGPESGDGQGGARINMAAGQEGSERVEFSGASMSSVVTMLTGLLGRPVVHRSGLTGRYDFALEFSRDETVGPGGGGGYNEPPRLPPPPPGAAPGVSIYSSIQRLGLHLDGQKLPLEVVVIDRAERTPTEN